MVKINFSKQGKKNRASGARFELKVRKDMEEQGWVIAKWTNNVDLELRKIIPAKRKYNPFLKALSIGTGFPDFVAIKTNKEKTKEVIGVEVKSRGYLDKEEKEKCRIYLENGVFSQILVAKMNKEKNKINIDYEDFIEKYKENDK